MPFTPALPRAAYLHVPFCAHRCGYCNFTLVAGRSDLIPQYLQAIEIELAGLETPREVETIFFGGGTPTQLSPEQLSQLCGLVKHWLPLRSTNSRSPRDSGGSARDTTPTEWSVEANPADVTAEKLDVLAAAGVTRISLGAQSFREEKLISLERDHRAADIYRALKLARERGMQVSLDLIFAAPGETLADWQHDLEAAILLSPDHISTYGLTFERGTQFWNRLQRGELASSEESLEAAMYEAGIDTLSAAGFEHYEVSNFARRTERGSLRCRHNEIYWTGGGYYAFGPGAARYIAGERSTNHRSTTTYLQRVLVGQSPIAECETLPPEDTARERLVFALRRLEGIDLAEFQQATGYSAVELGGDALQKHIRWELLELTSSRLRLTRKGLLVSDAIWPDFLAE